GGYGGCYGCYGCYGGAGYGAGYAVPAYYGSAVPTVAPTYSPTPTAMGVYGTPRPIPAAAPTGTSVTVTTPRASFALSLGNGVIIGRSALATGRLTGLWDRPIEAPPSDPLPTPRSSRRETLPTPHARPGET